MKGILRLKQFTSAIIAFDLANNQELSDLSKTFGKDAEPSENFHMTLVYLGADVDIDSAKARLLGLSKIYAPIVGKFNGVAKFTDNGDGVPVILTYDSVALAGFRQALREAFPEVEQTHGFIPHVTLAYVTEDVADNNPVVLEKPIEYTFNSIWLYAGEEHYQFPLTGNVVEKGGKGSGNFGHKGRLGKIGGSSLGNYANIANTHIDYISNRFGIYPKVEILDDLQKASFPISGGSLGAYDPNSDAIALSANLISRVPSETDIELSGDVRNLAQLGYKFLITHEMGHSFDIANRSASLSDRWKSIADRYHSNHDADYNFKYKKNDSVISGYSMLQLGYSQYVESFAEAFAAYVHRPEWLMDKNPDMYKFMEDLETGNA